jgi:alcohol dehydrogenase-like protein
MVNLLDSKIRNGEFKRILPYRLPLILGHDVAGVVVRVGSRVRRFRPGDEVYARPADGQIGAFAELIAIKEDDLAITPKALTMEEAASIPLVGLTAWQALIERAHLKQGQKVLIHAGSGGVGTFAIQPAKHVGATVGSIAAPHRSPLGVSLDGDATRLSQAVSNRVGPAIMPALCIVTAKRRYARRRRDFVVCLAFTRDCAASAPSGAARGTPARPDMPRRARGRDGGSA